MQIQVNGKPTDIKGEITISALLSALDIEPEQVAVEIDRNVVPRASWDEQRVHEGASIEIVRFVGGG